MRPIHDVEPDVPGKHMDWCCVGEGGIGYFWGSHGCFLGDHSSTGDPHIHRCASGCFDQDGKYLGFDWCLEIDDRTSHCRRLLDNGQWSNWDDLIWQGWWQ